MKALGAWVQHALFETSSNESAVYITTNEKQGIVSALLDFKYEIEARGIEELTVNARGLMEKFATVVSGTLMAVDAERDGDPVSLELFRRFAKVGGFASSVERDWRTDVEWDSRIVFGRSSTKGIPQARL